MSKLSKQLTQLIDFIHFTHEFREVVRVARAPGSSRFENDAEHSYQLAMVAWFLIDQKKLKLNKGLCFMYALAHDLVEIYAGDTYIFDAKSKSSKEKREKEAMKKIKKRFAHFKHLISIIEEYENKKTKESRFIYALDKLMGPVQIYMENGKLFKENKVTLDKIIEYKNPKISLSKDVDEYWQELLSIMKKEEKKLFL